MKRDIERLVVWAIGILLYILFRSIGISQRGSDAVGGEFLILVLPVIYLTLTKRERNDG